MIRSSLDMTNKKPLEMSSLEKINLAYHLENLKNPINPLQNHALDSHDT